MKGIELVGRFGVAVLAALLATSSPRAQDANPSRPITIVVPYPPGGLIDVVARSLAQGLKDRLDQPTVVLNKPGANGKIALGELVRAEPDGHTLLVNNDGGIGIPPAIDPNFRFDFSKDFTPIAQAADTKWIALVRSGLPVGDLQGLIDYARARPGELNFGSPGFGTTPHLATELLMQQTGVKMVHVSFAGAAPATTALIGGQIDVLVSSVPAAKGYFGSDRMRVLAVLSDARVAELPDVPTVAEAGLQSIAVNGWVGVFGPPGMSPQVLDKLNAAIGGAVNDRAQGERLRALGAEPKFMDVKDFPSFYQAEVRRWKAFAAERGVTLKP